ncbi:MAG: hypothetical protein GXN92_00900 [Candidatus Micrarchaeota archaeon]|nr:hypothetical protein [Candidatus Micrarchaeota archaeon]
MKSLAYVKVKKDKKPYVEPPTLVGVTPKAHILRKNKLYQVKGVFFDLKEINFFDRQVIHGVVRTYLLSQHWQPIPRPHLHVLKNKHTIFAIAQEGEVRPFFTLKTTQNPFTMLEWIANVWIAATKLVILRSQEDLLRPQHFINKELTQMEPQSVLGIPLKTFPRIKEHETRV